MCGRYTLTRQERVAEELEAALGDAPQSEWWKPRYNVAPTQPAPVVIATAGTRTIEMMRWGLVPHWAGRDGKRAPLMINARAESLHAKQFFRDAMQRRRCLVPANGFFEWVRSGKVPQPMYVHPADDRVIAFAGLWAKARTDAGEQLSFTIITGPPHALVKPFHDRMPVVLAPTAYAAWLDPDLDADGARALLALPALDGWRTEPVSVHVNKAANDDPQCIAPLGADAPAQPSLFDGPG